MQRLKQLWQLRKYCKLPHGAVRMNCLAALIGLMAFGILVLSFHATPAGAGLDAASLAGPQLTTGPAPVIASTTGGGTGLSSLSMDEINQRIQGAIHGSKLAMQLHVALLEVGKQRLENFPDYTATFFKQEKVDGDDLQELQTLQLKLRHKPFSVYMKWLEGGDVGRQVLYVEGEYENRMLVKFGGAKARLLPILKLEPTGALAMKESRHPIVEMGLLQLSELIIKYRKRDLGLKDGVRWQMLADQKVMDRDCHCFIVEYDSKEIEPVYRKSITYIDKELSIPICVRSYGWPEADSLTADPQTLDAETLIEYYGYKDVEFESRLTASDFDKANAEYKFRR
ncbi:MAG: DUF1571 domain-containing protein [Planctomycetaceae bacterium]|nr:DUF1571 domain-containing protein [Planctomycetaceae bacterium]